MNRQEIVSFIKNDEVIIGIKITNMEAVLDHIIRLFELRKHTVRWYQEEYIRFYVHGYAAGVQSRAGDRIE